MGWGGTYLHEGSWMWEPGAAAGALGGQVGSGGQLGEPGSLTKR